MSCDSQASEDFTVRGVGVSLAYQCFILAGEPSADRLGKSVMQSLRDKVSFFGVGGDDMMAEGLDSIAPSHEFTIIGMTQILKAIPRLSRLADDLIDEIMKRRPDAIVTIDSKGFSLRFAKRLKKRMAKHGWHAPIIHLVAPTVWCWGKWRAKPFATVMDKLLCLFPFEPLYFTPYGGVAEYVGHPLFERDIPEKTTARKDLKLSPNLPVLVLLPGSRNSEIKQLMPVMLEAQQQLKARYPDLTTILPVSSHVAPRVREMLAGHEDIRCVHGDSQTMTALAAGDVGIICSGTVTLEAAMTGLQGVVVYKPDWFSMFIGWLLADLDQIVLANVVTKTTLYPLLLWRKVTANALVNAVIDGFANPDHGQRIRQAMHKVIASRADQSFGTSAAQAIISSITDNKTGH
jgi:lipid-A-disaccharide synthase